MDGGFPPPGLGRDCTPPAEDALRAFDVSTATPFEAFFRRNHDFVWRNLRRLGVEAATVDDALQDVFVTAHRRLAQLRPDASERAWLYTILRRVAFRYRRSARRRRRKIDALEVVAPTEHSDHTARGMDARRFMHGFLDRLGDKRGPVFAMVQLEGMSAPEVADALGVKVNTVYSRLRLGREAFERELERRHDREREELLAQAHRADDPPVGAAAAAWMLIDPRLLGAAPASAPAAWSLASQVKVFVATVAMGSVLVVGGRALGGERVAPSVAQAPAPVAASELPKRSVPAPTVEVPAPQPSPAPVVAAASEPRMPAPAPAVKARPRAAERGIDVEAALLKRAKAAMTAGDSAAALRHLAAHAERFPASSLGDLRDAMRVSALCASGEVERARAAADAFERAHPGSRFGARVRSTCRGDGS